MVIETKGFNLDPRTKLLMWTLANVSVFVFSSSIFPLILMAVYMVLFILASKLDNVIKLLGVYAGILVIEFFVLPNVVGQLATVFATISYFRFIFPAFVGGQYIIETTSVGQLIAGMRKWHLPESLSISMAATLRFLPVLRQEIKNIRYAMKLRNIKGLRVKLESTYVPMLAGMANVVDEVSESVIARGIENPGKKTSWEKIGIRLGDILILAIFIAVTATAIVWKIKGL